jgi:hypothetical protein
MNSNEFKSLYAAFYMNIDKGALIRKLFILDGYQRAVVQKNVELVHLGELSIEQGAANARVSIGKFLEIARELNVEIDADASSIEYETEIIKKHLT